VLIFGLVTSYLIEVICCEKASHSTWKTMLGAAIVNGKAKISAFSCDSICLVCFDCDVDAHQKELLCK
jgi:hypothetical protein